MTKFHLNRIILLFLVNILKRGVEVLLSLRKQKLSLLVVHILQRRQKHNGVLTSSWIILQLSFFSNVDGNFKRLLWQYGLSSNLFIIKYFGERNTFYFF